MLTRRDFHAALLAAYPAKNHTWEQRLALRDKIDPGAEARRHFVETLEGSFERFCEEASYADLLFLEQVFERHDGDSRPVETELTLASAFAKEIGRDEAYFRVVGDDLRNAVS